MNGRQKMKMNDWVKGKYDQSLGRIKQQPYKYGFLGAMLVLVIIPLFIWLLYLIGDNFVVIINTSLGVGDVLGFYGTGLTFVGTTFLGMVAFKQNEHHNKTEMELDNANTLTPFLAIREVKGKGKGAIPATFERSHYVLHEREGIVVIENIGQGLAMQLTYKTGFGKFSDQEDRQLNINLGINDSISIRLHVKDDDIGKIKEKVIKYQNIIGFMYEQTLRYKLISYSFAENEGEDEEDEYCLYVYPLEKQRRIGMGKSLGYDNCE